MGGFPERNCEQFSALVITHLSIRTNDMTKLSFCCEIEEKIFHPMMRRLFSFFRNFFQKKKPMLSNEELNQFIRQIEHIQLRLEIEMKNEKVQQHQGLSIAYKFLKGSLGAPLENLKDIKSIQDEISKSDNNIKKFNQI